MNVKPGEPIPLNLQTWDGAADKFVRAFLEDPEGNDLGMRDLDHSNRGLYLDNTFTMPNGHVIATYIVYNDEDLTMESQLHSRAEDTFEPFSAGGTVSKELTAEISLPSVEALVTAPVLEAVMDNPELTGEVASDEADGSVAAPAVTGETSSDDIEGTTVC